MPLELGNRGDVEVDVVAGLEREVGRPLDHQVDHPAVVRQQQVMTS